VTVELVRLGKTVEERGISGICEMLLQICRLYRSLPDPRSLTYQEILFYFDGIKEDLKDATKPR